MTFQDIQTNLRETGYIASDEIAIAACGAINHDIPLLIEGAPGVGKTSLAKAVAEMLSLPLIRVQFYEGLTYDKILYDYNYQKQLLAITAMRGTLDEAFKGKSVDDAVKEAGKIDFYSEDFLIKRPILQAFSGEERCVLLLDEVDKSSEEIEYTLLEALDEYAVSVPQFGRIVCPEDKRPIVFLTSNNYRELSDALRRRCGYLYLDRKTVEEMKEIIKAKAQTDDKLASAIAECLAKIQNLPLKQTPSVAEAITWASLLRGNGEKTIDQSSLDHALYLIIKNKKDRDLVRANMQEILPK